MKYDVSRHNAEREIRLPDAEIAERYLSGATTAELATAFFVSRPTIAKSLAKSGVQMRPAKQRPGILAGDANPAWKGGRRQRADGYWLVQTPDGERLEHRVVMERKLGRHLRDDEIVHHVDEDKSNNDPENLAVMSQSDHARHHAPAMHQARNGNG